MSQQYNSFIQEIWSNFTGLADAKLTDLSDHNILWTLTDYIDAGYVNFKEGRKELYRLSNLLENYAVKYNVPLQPHLRQVRDTSMLKIVIQKFFKKFQKHG